MTVRDATAGDATAICRIYNQGIQDRVATLETEARSPEERQTWLAARGPQHPVLVAVAEGTVIAWSGLNAYNTRRAYDHVADLSLYVERNWRGRGVGRRLLDALVGRARALGYHKLVLAAFPFNGDARVPARGLPRGRDLPGAGPAQRPMGRHDRHGEDPDRPERPLARTIHERERRGWRRGLPAGPGDRPRAGRESCGQGAEPPQNGRR